MAKKRRSLADDDAMAFVFGNTTEPQESTQNPESSTPPSLKKPQTEQNTSVMVLDQIKNRDADTRDLNPKHVGNLAMSIMAIGLIEPLVVDQDGVLLAGGHRKAALIKLKDPNYSGDAELFERLFPNELIPVRVMPFSAADDPRKALEIEIAENEQRRDYTVNEIKEIAQRLKDAGFEELKGRPAKGQKPLMPALSAVVGKSIRRIQEVLQEDLQESTRNRALSDSDVYIKRAIANLEKWEKSRGKKRRETNLAKELPELLDKLREGLGNE